MSVLQKLFTERQTSGDIELICATGDREWAHRCILSGKSPVLRAMFYGSMQESHESAIPLDLVPDAPTLLGLLEYCYLGADDPPPPKGGVPPPPKGGVPPPPKGGVPPPPKGGVPPPPKGGVHWPRLLTIPQL